LEQSLTAHMYLQMAASKLGLERKSSMATQQTITIQQFITTKL